MSNGRCAIRKIRASPERTDYAQNDDRQPVAPTMLW